MSHRLRQPPLDLFGQVPVTNDEIFAWVAAVSPRWLTPERSFRRYVLTYNVPDKIRAAKLRGTFHTTIEKPRKAWHARLALNAIV